LYTVLEVDQQLVKGHKYFRVNLPKKLTDRLQINDGDILTLEIKAVKRDGAIIYQVEDGQNAA
jgi:hypothetical protein